MSEAGQPGPGSHQRGPPALPIASAAAGRPGMRGGWMTADGRWCRFPARRVKRVCCSFRAGRAETEAVLLGGFVVELGRVAGVPAWAAWYPGERGFTSGGFTSGRSDRPHCPADATRAADGLLRDVSGRGVKVSVRLRI